MLRTLSQVAATAMVILAIGLLTPGRAEPAMHLHLEKSRPANDTLLATPPTQLRLWFSEAPRLKLTRVTLTGPKGAVKLGVLAQDSVEHNEVVAPIVGQLVDGDYIVSWRAASSDGHLAKGTVKFGVRPE